MRTECRVLLDSCVLIPEDHIGSCSKVTARLSLSTGGRRKGRGELAQIFLHAVGHGPLSFLPRPSWQVRFGASDIFLIKSMAGELFLFSILRWNPESSELIIIFVIHCTIGCAWLARLATRPGGAWDDVLSALLANSKIRRPRSEAGQ